MARIVELTDEELGTLEAVLREKHQRLIHRFAREEEAAAGAGKNTLREASALARVLETLGRPLRR